MAVSMIGPRFYAWDADGKPLAGGLVYTYRARTNEKKVTYTNEDGTFENTNPVVLNSAGYASIYLDGSYKIVVKDASGKEIWTEDPVNSKQAVSEWLPNLPASQADANSFTVIGNQTELFTVGRALRLKDIEHIYGVVVSASYADGKTTVAVDIPNPLTAELAQVSLSVLSGLSEFNNRNRTRWFDTKAELEAAEGLELGQFVATRTRTSKGEPGDLYRVVASGTGAVDGVFYFNLAGGYQAELLDRKTLTVNIPSDYATLQAAVDALTPHRAGRTITLNIETGHQPVSGIAVANGDYSAFRVTATGEVTLSANFPANNAFITADNAIAPTLDALVNANGECLYGYNLVEGSRGTVNPGCGVKNAVERGLNISNNSHCFAHGSIWTGAGVYGVLCLRGSTLTAENLDASDSDGYGVYVAYGSTAYAMNLKAENCENHSLWVGYASSCDAHAGNASTLLSSRATSVNTVVTVLSGSSLSLSSAPGVVAVTQNGSAVGISVQASTLAMVGAHIEGANAGTGVSCSKASSVDAQSASIDGFTTGANVSASVLNGEGLTVTGAAGDKGVSVSGAATINLNTASISGFADPLYIVNGANVAANAITITGATNNGATAYRSQLCLSGASITGSSGNDIACFSGSTVQADTCTTSNGAGAPDLADVNLAAFNTLYSDGVIFS